MACAAIQIVFGGGAGFLQNNVQRSVLIQFKNICERAIIQIRS